MPCPPKVSNLHVVNKQQMKTNVSPTHVEAGACHCLQGMNQQESHKKMGCPWMSVKVTYIIHNVCILPEA